MSCILVVDDETEVREVLTVILGVEDYTVHTAQDGAEALAHLDQHRPALVLLDLAMPVLDGWGFLAQCRARADWRDLPVIVVSGYQHRDPVAEYGALAFLPKPFNTAVLRDCVAAALDFAPAAAG